MYKEPKLRSHLWELFREKILRIPKEVSLPRWAYIFTFFFFPLEVMKHIPGADPRFEPWNDRFIIFGKEYSIGFFRHFATEDPRFYQVLKSERNNRLITVYTWIDCDGCPLKKKEQVNNILIHKD